ncbi:endosome-associated ubiquitin isopeptidase-like protein [Tricladium varicosporioides]|nr:endosome-associated ubiquitin isopeptidase-like protein [Hymenoscyphus varicosporioides]
MAGSTLQTSRPMSVKEIALKAEEFDFDPYIALKYWLRTASTLLREAQIYEQERNDQQAYFLLMRYAILVAEKLPTHPSATEPDNRRAVKAIRGTVPEILDKLEVLKPPINARYSAWQKALERRREVSIDINEDGLRSKSRDPAASDPAVAGNTTTLSAAENSDLAVKLAHKEIRRRDAARKATRQAGVSEEEEQERRTAGVWDDWEAALSNNGRPAPQDDDEIRRNMEASRRRMDGSHDIMPDGVRKRVTKPPPRPPRPEQSKSVQSNYRYPSISKSQPLQYNDASYDSRPRSRSPRRTNFPPKPPKERFEELMPFQEPPRLPEKAMPEPEDTNLSNGKLSSSFTFRPSAYLENGNPLRTVFLPPTLRERFLQYAAPNTRKNLETCGMLCGTLISNALFISKVVIPEQESTSDTCETINESAFFDYCASEDLMVLGWIHTHPSQTCFMSSRDLHTHAGYQIMMPESIAIVCAPSKTPSWGVFRMTDPPGMQAVLNCRKTGLFHPHDETNIYTDALRPGHVFEAEGMEFEVIDMRPK